MRIMLKFRIYWKKKYQLHRAHQNDQALPQRKMLMSVKKSQCKFGEGRGTKYLLLDSYKSIVQHQDLYITYVD